MRTQLQGGVWLAMALAMLSSASGRPMRRKKKSVKSTRKAIASARQRSLQEQFGESGKGKGKGGSDTCEVWPYEGDCVSTPDISVAGAIQLALCGNPDVDFLTSPAPAFMCDAYNRYIYRLFEQVSTNSLIPVLGSCSGEFTGSELRGEATAKRTGCDDIPVAMAQEYGVVSASFDGGFFVPFKTNVCIAASPPDCGFMFSMAAGAGLINSLFGLINPVPGPAGDLAATIQALGTNLNKVVFGIGEAGMMEFPVAVYTPTGGFQEAVQQTNFFIRGKISNVWLPGPINAVIPTSQEAGIYWSWPDDHFTNNLQNLASALSGVTPVDLGLQYSTAITRIVDTDFRLSLYTANLLPDLDIAQATEWGYLVRNNDRGVALFADLPPGYYSSFDYRVPLIDQNAKLICDTFAAFEVECPTVFQIDPSSQTGFYLTDAGEFGFQFNWVGLLEVGCVNTGEFPVVLDCQTSEGRNIRLFQNRRGLTAEVVDKTDDDVAVPVMNFSVSMDAVNAHGHLSREAGKFYRALDRLNDSGHPGTRKLEETDFGFEAHHECAGGSSNRVELFDTGSASFAEYSIQHGHDGTLRNCLAACTIERKRSSDKEMTCCEYRKANSQSLCVLKSTSSTEPSVHRREDHQVWSSTSFLQEFATLVNVV